MTRDPIYVTRPAMPPFDEVSELLKEVWRGRILTNYGPIHQRLEAALCGYLGVDNLSLVSNATLGCVMALRHVAGRGGEVVTTPFSFVATSHAVRLSGAEVVFADVDPVTLNLDPASVEERIGPRTVAILAVHCYGIPCDHAGLAAVADRHGLPLVYDAAHAMGARVGDRSLASLGDFSVLSFHATKVFSTVEGGAVVSPSRADKIALDRLGNHGIVDEARVDAIGLNAKMSELHAAFGLALLPHLDGHLAARGVAARRYDEGLAGARGVRIVNPSDRAGQNFYAYPVLIGPEHPLTRDGLYERLKAHGVYARRYFFPSIASLPMYRDLPSARPDLIPVATDAARRVLCLPLFPDLDPADQDRVIELVRAP